VERAPVDEPKDKKDKKDKEDLDVELILNMYKP